MSTNHRLASRHAIDAAADHQLGRGPLRRWDPRRSCSSRIIANTAPMVFVVSDGALVDLPYLVESAVGEFDAFVARVRILLPQPQPW